MISGPVIILICAFAIQLMFYLYMYGSVLFYREKTPSNKYKALTVIISARNEAENLKKFLPHVLKQNYFEFEVIVIDDCSEDDTGTVLSEFKKIYSHLKVYQLNSITGKSGKKEAITIAVNSAKYKYLVFTDADCRPVSDKWLKKIFQCYSEHTEIVLGYGAYLFEKSFLNSLIRFDTLFIGLQYFSFAIRGFSYMGVGRNLSYKKSIFVNNNGFNSHSDLKSGDDDLFVNEVSAKDNVSLCMDPDSKTLSTPKSTFKDLIVQKKRHLQAGLRYKFKHKVLIGTEIFSRLIFYLSLICLLTTGKPLILAGSIYFIRLLIQFLIVGSFSKKMNEKNNLIFIPIFDILIPIINLFAVVSTYFKKDKVIKWK